MKAIFYQDSQISPETPVFIKNIRGINLSINTFTIFEKKSTMELSLIINIVSISIGVIGLVHAIYTNREKRKLSRFIKEQSWKLFTKATTTLKHIQDNIQDEEAQCNMHRADALSQDIVRDLVFQIYTMEPKYSKKKIEKWYKNGKFNEKYMELFVAHL